MTAQNAVNNNHLFAMVIHHIENNADAQGMCLIYEVTQIIRRTVMMEGRKECNTIVTPTVRAIEFCQRH